MRKAIRYNIRTNSDPYWNSFQLCRMRLAQIWKLRHEFSESWCQQDFETFMLHARLLIEQISIFIRDMVIDRTGLSRSAIKHYTPIQILRPHTAALTELRFVVLNRIVTTPQVDGVDFDIQWSRVVYPDVDQINKLYGLSNSFLHVTAKGINEQRVNNVLHEFFQFFSYIAPVFDRHAIERQVIRDAPPDLALFELVVGREDTNGQDEFWECAANQWTSRLTTLAQRGRSPQ